MEQKQSHRIKLPGMFNRKRYK